MTSQLSNYLNAINQTKENLVTDETTDYNPYVINHCMSHQDTVLIANEMNIRSQLSPIIVNKFYLDAITKRKRFSKWYKIQKISDLELIQKAYKYNVTKAKQALLLLTSEQLQTIRDKFTEKNK